MDSRYGDFEPVIGLEVHAQLMTKSKIFCSCSTEFGAPANANTCPVCAGHPGTLPVLNEKAVEYAVKAALATNCAINLNSIFARKNYFYPDLPKGYQISQYEAPLAVDGYLDIEVESLKKLLIKRVGLVRIHMEEDAGKSVHSGHYSLVNLNRAGIPLVEIVSHPDLRSPEEAGAYLRKLRAILMYIDVCDGNMQEGSFRCDANVSIRPVGSSQLGKRTEIKNVNSFRFVEKAIEYEIHRQTQVIQSGGTVVQETRLYDSAKNVTVSMRSKEEAHDYRYFPEPDLLPLVITEGIIEKLKTTLPELPDQKKDRFIKEMGIPAYDAGVITSSKALAQFFEEIVHICRDPKTVSNWVMGELLRLLKQDDRDFEEIQITPSNLGQLIQMIQVGTINNTIAKTIFEDMYNTGKNPEDIVREKGLMQISDSSAILTAVEKVITANPSQVAELKAGKTKLLGFFVGQVMKEMGGKANPNIVNELLKKRIDQK